MNFDKEFWDKFLSEHGSNFDGYARLLYIYADNWDLEEANCTMKVYTETILEVIIHHREEREEVEDGQETGKTFIDKWNEPNYLPMDQINDVHFQSDITSIEKPDS